MSMRQDAHTQQCQTRPARCPKAYTKLPSSQGGICNCKSGIWVDGSTSDTIIGTVTTRIPSANPGSGSFPKQRLKRRKLTLHVKFGYPIITKNIAIGQRHNKAIGARSTRSAEDGPNADKTVLAAIHNSRSARITIVPLIATMTFFFRLPKQNLLLSCKVRVMVARGFALRRARPALLILQYSHNRSRLAKCSPHRDPNFCGCTPS